MSEKELGSNVAKAITFLQYKIPHITVIYHLAISGRLLDVPSLSAGTIYDLWSKNGSVELCQHFARVTRK